MSKEKATRINAIFYSMGLIVIMLIWLNLCAAELSVFSLLRFSLLIILGYVAMVFDIHTKRIPNVLVLTMIMGWLPLILSSLFFDPESAAGIFMDSAFGLLFGGGIFLLVYAISSKGLGGGDVKFMAAAGLYLGFANTILAILYGTIIAALTAMILILLKKIGRKDSIPLVPFLFAGIMITVFTTHI